MISNNYNKSKRGQVTIFIIIAIVIVAAVILIYSFRGNIFPATQKVQFDEVYTYFDSCIKTSTQNALGIAGSQGGYIEIPQFYPGSKFAPFSSQLNFLGNNIPYWYYVSGNSLVKEQVPSKGLIENQVEKFINSDIRNCDFSDFISEGYNIGLENVTSRVSISETYVDVGVNAGLIVTKGEATATKTSHEVRFDSKFGKFYTLAREIYDKEKKESFLENYSKDILMSYAPVVGTELSCKPKIWKAPDVVSDLQSALEANIGALKVSGNYYNLKNKENKYFVIQNVESDEPVSFMYSADWPTRIQIWPTSGSLMVAKPVGLEQGMGILGFCYVPYQFIYDVYFPVLVQINDGNELFQFPVSVVIDKNTPRKAIAGQSLDDNNDSINELCNYKNTPVQVFTYDKSLSPVKSTITFSCLDVECDIGETEISGGDAKLTANFPQCINGKITATAEGYVTQDYFVSTNEPAIANILMDRVYDLDLSVVVGGRDVKLEKDGLAMINFEGEKSSYTVVYPDQDKIELSEDNYNISVQVFGGSELTVPASSSRQCVNVPASGIMGFFGQENEQCFDVNTPEQKLTNSLIGGGKSSQYVLEEDLKLSKELRISVSALATPTSLDQLQQNYDLYSKNNVDLTFK
ncbi:MAG: hypothetical protein WC796_02515 [Candidatus Pacearchaeota archaeon]|jgi:hypothetical protein